MPVLASFPDPQKASEDLQTFAEKNEGRLYKLLKTCMDLQTDLKSLVKARVSTTSFCLAEPLTTLACSTQFHSLTPVPRMFTRANFCADWTIAPQASSLR
jgi:hypothetical protein